MAGAVSALSSYSTVMRPESRLTSTSLTPSSFCTRRVTLAWQAAHVMPVTLNFCIFTVASYLSFFTSSMASSTMAVLPFCISSTTQVSMWSWSIT